MNNPLIGETHADTLNNVTESLSALVTLMAHTDQHGGIARLMEPLLHALEHASNEQA